MCQGEGAVIDARFVPDCFVLVRRLASDRRVARRVRLALAGLVVYLACPLDLVPDFIPVIGLLDDALVLVLVLRYVLRSGGPGLVREHWPGSEQSLQLVLSAAQRPGG